MDFLERDLEDIIYEAPQSELRDRGLFTFRAQKVYRQVPLMDYGIADLITVNSVNNPDRTQKERRVIYVTVYELKQNKIDVGVLLQAAKYYAAARQIVEAIYDNQCLFRTVFRFEVVLVGRTVDTTNSFTYLFDLFSENLKVFTYKYCYDGIKFRPEYGYRLPKCDITSKADLYTDDWKEMISIDRYMAHAKRQQTVDLPF